MAWSAAPHYLEVAPAELLDEDAFSAGWGDAWSVVDDLEYGVSGVGG